MDELVLLADGATAQNLSIFDPATSGAAAIRDLALLVFFITGLIFVVVEGVLFYTIYRFWRRAPNDDRTEPPQVYGSQPIEVAWTAAPTLIVFVLVLVTTRTLWEVDVDAAPPAEGDNTLFVTVVGRQWWWEYQYDHFDGQPLGFVTANELHAPQGARVNLRLRSADVCHSFWVPRLAGKTDLIPGRDNALWFQCDRPDLYLGQCAEYCGTQHANMLLRVVVQPPDEFAAWLENQQLPAVDDPTVQAGRALFLGQSCVNCHRVRGTPADGAYGPDLTHLMSRQTLASGMIPNNRQQLRRWLVDPKEVKPGCLMPAFGLADDEWDRIVDFLQTLR